MAQNQETKIVTGPVRFSYANVLEARSINGGEPKYSASILISKKDTKTLELVEKATKAAIDKGKEEYGDKFTLLKLPLRDGDEERPDDEAYKGCYFLNASSKWAPDVVDRNLEPIESEKDFYSGVIGRASLNFYPFNRNGNKGVAVGLNNVQKLKDGEPLTTAARAEDDFGDIEINDEDLPF